MKNKTFRDILEQTAKIDLNQSKDVHIIDHVDLVNQFLKSQEGAKLKAEVDHILKIEDKEKD